MTHYIASYDTENPKCLAGCKQIVKMHRKHEMPATFFITGTTIEGNTSEYRELLDDPLFEIASHTYSHRMLRDHPMCGPAASPEGVREEIVRGKELVEDVFERKCRGLRPGCSFVDALHGATDALAIVAEAGYDYVSSMAWGKDYSLPAPLNQAHTYEEDGHPDIMELPCHGWHDNLLKDNNKWGPRRITLWPQPWPEAVPAGFVKDAADEFAINKVVIDRAAKEELGFVSLIWHPWSLHRFDPDMEMLDLTFRYVRELGLTETTYAGYRDIVTEK
jgi:peptidoglycan/xylan/chitin deacetylase (PgdA/CDA1 family)